jgi:hypothetical protein
MNVQCDAEPPSERLSTRFKERYARWHQLHLLEGPGRAYPYAWRLPEMARPLGQPFVNQAHHALALDLYCLGRFPEALAALPAEDEGEVSIEMTQLRRYIHCLSQADPVDSPIELPLDDLYLNYLHIPVPSVSPHLATQACHAPLLTQSPSSAAQPWQGLLQAWLAVQQAQNLHEVVSAKCHPKWHTTWHAKLHSYLASLRAISPCLGAQAEAIFAEIQYCIAPRWSVVWVDHALDKVESFSQHHLKARLLFLKAQALAASGELAESLRFQRLAITLAKRQGALRYLALGVHQEGAQGELGVSRGLGRG